MLQTYVSGTIGDTYLTSLQSLFCVFCALLWVELKPCVWQTYLPHCTARQLLPQAIVKISQDPSAKRPRAEPPLPLGVFPAAVLPERIWITAVFPIHTCVYLPLQLSLNWISGRFCSFSINLKVITSEQVNVLGPYITNQCLEKDMLVESSCFTSVCLWLIHKGIAALWEQVSPSGRIESVTNLP